MKSAENASLSPPLDFFQRLTSHIPPGQFLRYIVVGSLNTLFGYWTFAGIYYLLHRYEIPTANIYWQVITAQIISSPINITAAYLGYKLAVFRTKGNYLREWLKSIAVYGTAFVPGLVLMPLLVAVLIHVPHLRASAPYVASALLTGVGVIYSFLGHKHVTFRVSSGKTGPVSE